jgi:membrane protease YdiL (CAAX protease family)
MPIMPLKSDFPPENYPCQGGSAVNWSAVALGAAVFAMVLSHLILALLVKRSGDLPKVLVLGLSVVPLHVAGLLAAMGVVAWGLPAGNRLRFLGLVPEELSRRLVKEAGWRLLGVYPLVCAVTLVTAGVLQLSGYEPEGAKRLTDILAGFGPGGLTLFVGFTVLLAPVAEEIIFRGLCHDVIAGWNRELAPALTALLFAWMHQIPEQLPGLFLLGMLLQSQRRKNGHLWGCILLHAGFNAITVALWLSRLV